VHPLLTTMKATNCVLLHDVTPLALNVTNGVSNSYRRPASIVVEDATRQVS